jgi:isomerase DpgB
MVSGNGAVTHAGTAAGDVLELRIDGAQPLGAGTVAAVAAVCDRAEDLGGTAVVVVRVSGSPAAASGTPTLKLVNQWERVLRRLERLPATTIAVVEGDCGGAALDALLTTDHRIAAPSARLILPVRAGSIWPGMALYRLARQAASAAAARHAALLGGVIEARAALASHLVHDVADDLPAALGAMVAHASVISGTELAVRRQLVLDAPTVGFEEALGTHLAACDRALRLIADRTAP